MTEFPSARLLVRAMKPDELPLVGHGLADSFARTPDADEWLRDAWAPRFARRPGYSPLLHRVGLLDGELVCHVRIEPLTLRYGGARIRVAGLAGVYTLAAYRGRGYAAAVMRDALTHAIELGADLALLNGGVRGYYNRFGFSPVFPDYQVEFAADELATLPAPLALREPRPNDIPLLAALFERHWGWRVTAIRSAETWVWRVLHGDDNRRVGVVVGDDDRPQGYIAGRDWLAPEVEVLADTPDAALTLLAHAGTWAQAAGLERLRWLMPPDDALVSFAQRLVAVDVSAHYEPDGGWMGRLLDAQGLIDALLPELLTQARQTLPDLVPEQVIFSSRAGGVEIGLRHQPETVALLSPRDFNQLVFGSLSPTLPAFRRQYSAESVRLLQALFPARVAALAGWDWF